MEELLDKSLLPKALKEKINSVSDYMDFMKIRDWYWTKEKGLVIKGDAKLIGIVGEMPIKISRVKGNLNLSYNFLTTLKNIPMVTGDLNLSGNKLRSIDHHIRVGGSIKLDTNKNLRDISGLPSVINGNLSAAHCNIKTLELGHDMHIKGNMSMPKNNLPNIKLTNKIIVDGDVSLSDNQIAREETNIEAKSIDLSGNPCNAKDEFETSCVW